MVNKSADGKNILEQLRMYVLYAVENSQTLKVINANIARRSVIKKVQREGNTLKTELKKFASGAKRNLKDQWQIFMPNITFVPIPALLLGGQNMGVTEKIIQTGWVAIRLRNIVTDGKDLKGKLEKERIMSAKPVGIFINSWMFITRFRLDSKMELK